MVASRLFFLVPGWLALVTVSPPPEGTWVVAPGGGIEPAVKYPPRTFLPLSPLPLLNLGARWDSGWYLSIVKEGYFFHPAGPSNSAFWPVYPMLIRLLVSGMRNPSDAAILAVGMIISNLALAIAAIYLFLLIRIDWEEAVAWRALLYILFFPTAWFFSAVYAESLFLALLAASFYYARRRRWWVAGLLAALVTLTRIPGITLFPALLFEYLAQRRFQLRKIRSDLLPLLLSPAALAGHFLFLRLRFHRWDVVTRTEALWNRHLSTAWHRHGSIIDLLFTLPFLFLVIRAFKLRPSYGIYSLCYFLLVTATGVSSMPRFELLIFPAFILLALAGRSLWFHRIYLAITLPIGIWYVCRFVTWRWTA